MIHFGENESSFFGICGFFEGVFRGYLEGDKHKIRHVMYCCSASRPKTESSTKEESTEVKTETLSLKASALPDGLVKSKTCESTDETTYNNWYKSVYIPTFAASTTTTTKTS